MSKLFVVSELFYPGETSTAFVMTKIVNKLSEKYDEVEVICGNSNYDTIDKKSENYFLNKKVKLTVINGFKGSKNNLVTRGFRFVFLSFSMFVTLLRKVKSEDKVVIVTNPATIIILAKWLKSIKRMQLIILVHDVFPENTVPAGIIKSKESLLYRVLLKWFNSAYASADKLIVIGRDMKKVLQDKVNSNTKLVSEIEVIENWAEEKKVIQKKSITVPENKIIFQFAGNLGRVQGLAELIRIIKKTSNHNLEFHFVGEGAIKQDLIDFVSENKMTNVVFKGAYKREDQTEVLNACDISIVTLSQGMFGLGVPSKTYNVLAAGKAVMYIGDENSEIDLLVKEHKIGYSFQDEKSILDFFNSLNLDQKEQLRNFGDRARHLAETIYSEEFILNRYQDSI